MSSGATPPSRSERGVYALIAVVALIVIYLIAFVLKNTASVDISFVVASTKASLIWVMLICILLGIALGLAAARLAVRRPSRRSPTTVSGPLTGGTAKASPVKPSATSSKAAPGTSDSTTAPGGAPATPDDAPTTKL